MFRKSQFASMWLFDGMQRTQRLRLQAIRKKLVFFISVILT